jgi:formimidoylglutamate deiminase
VGLGVGQIADLVVLDGDDPYFAAASGDQILDRWIFASPTRPVRDVMVAGAWRIRDGRHADDEAIDRAFAKTLKKLANG